MYTLSNEQIDFILNDIRARGVGMEGLQSNLLDHICCIIEHDLEENGDFESFYKATVKTFFKKDLAEIEEETISLINNKHFYTMKKAMIISGGFSSVALTLGIILKFLHQPGAGIMVVLGITILSLVFLPLMFFLKIREKEKLRDRLLLGLASLISITFCMAVMFKLMHWPYANIMGLTSVGTLAFLFLPIYFITGIRQAETKVNTIVSSVLLLSICGLFLGLARSPGKSKALAIKDTESFLRSEQILAKEHDQVRSLQLEQTIDSLNNYVVSDLSVESSNVYNSCAALKAELLRVETGQEVIEPDFEAKGVLIYDGWAENHFKEGTEAYQKLVQLRSDVKAYNLSLEAAHNTEQIPLPETNNILSSTKDMTMKLLQDLTQIQMLVLQNQIN